MQPNAAHPTPAQLTLRHGLCDQLPLNGRRARTHTEDFGGRGPRIVNRHLSNPLLPSPFPSSRGAAETIVGLDKARRARHGRRQYTGEEVRLLATFGVENHEIESDWETPDGGARCSCTFPQAPPHSCDSVSLGRCPGALYQVPAMCASSCVICHLLRRDRSSQTVQSYTGINSQFEFRVARQPLSTECLTE